MRVPFEWLCELTGIDAPVDEVAQRLTNAGFEVETIHRTGGHWRHIVVGQVDRIDPHPNADRLTLPTITTGDQQVQVVCGASNFKVGDKIAFAHEGALLYDPRNPTTELKELKASTIRGVPSHGMLCSAQELGLGNDHDGIVVLDVDAPIGRPLVEVIGNEIIEFELKANRPDVLSMVGIAREAAALYESQFRAPPMEVLEHSLSSGLSVNLDIADSDLCPRYSAAFVIDVEVAESPSWLRKRLDLAGMRPINTIVDVTNYVMLELGQPLHAFDWDTLRGGLLGVRNANTGERLVTLDGQDRELTPETLCIVDAEGPVALAGVMGGLATEVTARTKTVLIESATFNPISVRRSARRLALRSEASRRFEKRLPPELTTVALARCVQLLAEIGAGRGEALSADFYPSPSTTVPVRLEFSRIQGLLGASYSSEEVHRVLTAIDFIVEEDGDYLSVTPPFWRRDVASPADVIEEIGRLVGYDRLPETLPLGRVTAGLPGEYDTDEDRVRDVMVGLGFAECVTYALTSESRMARLLPPDLLGGRSEQPLGDAVAWRTIRESSMNDAGNTVSDRLLPLDRKPVRLVNPLSVEESSLRLTGLSTLLEKLRENRRHIDRDLLLFEAQPSFLHRSGNLPEEPLVLTAVLGQRISANRWDDVTDIQLPFVRGLLDEIFMRIEIDAENVRHEMLQHPTFAAGNAVAASMKGRLLAAYGEISPAISTQFDIEDRTWAVLIDLSMVRKSPSSGHTFSSWSEYPMARRDLAVLVDIATAQADVHKAIQKAGQPLLQTVRLFDEYKGEQIAAGKRSLAYALGYGSPNRTLTDAEADKAHAKVVRALTHKFGAQLRN